MAMRAQGGDRWIALFETKDPDELDRVRRRLDAAGVEYRTGVMGGRSPRIVLTVARADARRAWAAIRDVGQSPDGDEQQERPAEFPWTAVALVGAVVVLHLVLVFADAAIGRGTLLRAGGLLHGRMLDEPWRLLTSIALHVDPPHVLWNGVSMMVFGVPLLGQVGRLRAAAIYLVAGIGGALTAVQFAEPGRITVGSSGAVAGLFGAWLVLALRRAAAADLPGRARVRVTGIAMLLLPSLLSPVTSSGRPVSVSSHVGGLATGMAIGALISWRLVARRRGDVDP